MILETNNLTKKYGKKFAIDKISIKINKGEIYALVGKNGAGKTTLMKLITGLIKPTEGNLSLWRSGFQSEFPYQYSKNVGSLIENAGLMLNMSGYDNIKMKCICFGINDSNYIWNLLKMVSLENEGRKIVKKYSLGMKQRLGIALALVGDPDLLVLDEPTNGLDPDGIAFMRRLMVDLNKDGKTIIISSHVLDELSKFSTRYGFINQGSMIKEISKKELETVCVSKNISIEDYYFSLINN